MPREVLENIRAKHVTSAVLPKGIEHKPVWRNFESTLLAEQVMPYEKHLVLQGIARNPGQVGKAIEELKRAELAKKGIRVTVYLAGKLPQGGTFQRQFPVRIELKGVIKDHKQIEEDWITGESPSILAKSILDVVERNKPGPRKK